MWGRGRGRERHQVVTLGSLWVGPVSLFGPRGPSSGDVGGEYEGLVVGLVT